jgi:VWFA-related protein
MKTRTATAVLVAAMTAVPLGAVPDGVRITTVVTDRSGKPVMGLTLKDFELRDDGVVQKLVAVEPRRAEPRRIAIFLDEFHIQPADSARVRDAVTRFVNDNMRADDTAVVLKPLDSLPAIRVTADRARLLEAIRQFEGRKDNFEPRSLLEEDTLGRAPALVAAGRAQVVLSGLRALAGQLGSAPGRSAILLVSEGFAQPSRRLSARGLPDAGVVERSANRYDVPVYVFDPRVSVASGDAGAELLGKLVSETGGALSRGEDLAGSLARAGREIDGGYTLTYQPSHGDDGRYHPVQVSVARRDADARSRSGYMSALSAEARRAMREASGPALPTRLLRRSPLINVWFGVTRATETQGRVVVTWEPGQNVVGTGRSSAARASLKATTKDGKVLFEGTLSPMRAGGATDPGDRAEFDAPSGRVQLDMTILGMSGQKLDYDARDLDVPMMKGAVPLLLPAIVISTQSAREFRAVTADVDASPDPSRLFRRTDRLVIRVPAYAAGAPVRVTGQLLNRLAQPIRDLEALPDAGGITQFDLPLASLAPGDYYLQFSVSGPGGPVDQRIQFKITG